jgi:hypothetical protein
VFCRHFLYETSCVLQALSLENELCSAGTFATKPAVFWRQFLYKTSCVLQALSLQKLCSAGTFSTKQAVFCRNFLYKTSCVLQARSIKPVVFCRHILYKTSCVLQALDLQNKLCSAGTLATKQVVFCRLYATPPTHLREFEHLQRKRLCHSANTICQLHKHLIV